MKNSATHTVAIVCMVCSLLLILYTYYASSPRSWTGLGKLSFVFESMGVTTPPAMKCTDTKKTSSQQNQTHHFPFRGGFRIGFNIVKSSRNFGGNESITLTTTADYTFLDNLVTLVDLWPGPISCSLFAPGSDFPQTLQAIHYLRECTSPLIKQLVTFHVYFPSNHIPPNLSSQPWETSIIEYQKKRDCKNPFKFGDEVQTYRKLRKLLYHINVGRNIAREMAQTYFVLPLDIELYPSPNTISEFFQIVFNEQNSNQINSSTPKVFVLPAFELHPNVRTLPNRKELLEKLFRDKLATIFHKNICEYCHHIPDLMGWFSNSSLLQTPNNKEVFSVTKRVKGQVMWEPFYIGTKSEPEFDERVTWEGRSDKRVQAYALCLLDYDFYILKNMFIVHRPGIKFSSHENITIVKEMDEEIKRVIVPELQAVYGQRQGCNV